MIDVKLDAFIPTDFIPQVSQKIAVYQQMAAARSEAEVDAIVDGVRDRFGTLPKPLENLVEITKLRTVAIAKSVTRVVVDEARLTLGVGSGFALNPATIPKFQSLTKNRFRFADGKIVVDLPGGDPQAWMPLLRRLLDAM